jgi:hypothetical protein
VYHPEWLDNPVLVLKKNDNEWRMCVDYTDLNKHCPKDPFALPCINQVIDSTAGCVLLCFLYCYSGYHQIALKEEDQIKMVFIIPFGAYAYTTMPFGLKNAGVTYQRAIQLCLADQLHRDVEAYVDDVIIKTRSPILRRLSTACDGFDGSLTDEVRVWCATRETIGFIVSHRRIEANPEKINAITAMNARKIITDI